MKILIAEDERISRRFLQKCLEESGHEVTACENGLVAWQAFESGDFHLVVSDWMMPELSGPELLGRIRASDKPGYCYTIMLTSRSEKEDIVTGMEAGADDFLSKPFDRNELRVRIRAGERIVQLEQNLAERNRELEQTNSLLNAANKRMSSDLEAAAEVQHSLLPKEMPATDAAKFAWGYRPCEELAGDILNVFNLDSKHIGMYVADVSGHGVAASLLSVTVSRVMTPEPWDSSLLSKRVERNGIAVSALATPAEVAYELNNRFPMTERYFTLVYAVLNTETRELRYISAGHPPILRINAAGEAAFFEGSDFAIGWIPDHTFTEHSVQLNPGDRLYIYSDGIPEAMATGGECYGNDRMIRCVTDTHDRDLSAAVAALLADAEAWCGASGPPDDISILGMDIV